jgi:hypothetical protein
VVSESAGVLWCQARAKRSYCLRRCVQLRMYGSCWSEIYEDVDASAHNKAGSLGGHYCTDRKQSSLGPGYVVLVVTNVGNTPQHSVPVLSRATGADVGLALQRHGLDWNCLAWSGHNVSLHHAVN